VTEGRDTGKLIQHWHVANRLREEIVKGGLVPGDRIEGETALAERYGVARGTVRRSLDMLREEGLLVSRHGRGTFVASVPVVRAVSLLPGDSACARLPDDPEREKRGLPPGVPLLTVTRADGAVEYYDGSLTDVQVSVESTVARVPA
jgi:GntR family transcriptional regulator